MREWMERSQTGELILLGLLEDDEIIGVGHIDFVMVPKAGTLVALNVREDKRSQGLGAIFIDAMENEIRKRGLESVELRVETKNVRAQKLYEQLGYRERGTSVETWEQYGNDGDIEIYTTDAIIMRKVLS